jgi:hypothetical protein
VVGVPLRFGVGPLAVAAYTYALGRAFVSHYERGGSYHDFTAAVFRAEVRRMIGLTADGGLTRQPAPEAAFT